MTYHVQILLLVRQPLFDRAALVPSIYSSASPMGRKSALRREIAWILRRFQRPSKLLICGLFQKGPSFGTGRDPRKRCKSGVPAGRRRPRTWLVRQSEASFSSPASRSRWTAGAGAWTTSLSSGCGVRSNTRPSICMSSPTASRPGASSASGSASTLPSGHTRRSAGERQPRPTAAPGLWI